MYQIRRPKVIAELRTLREADFPKQALRRAEATIGGFLADNRRVLEPGDRARKTLKHLRSAWTHRDSHDDSTVRKAARKLVKTAGHPVAFEELERRAREFAGLLQKVGRNRNEKARLEKAKKREVDDDGRLEQVVSRDRLQSIGKQLALCVGDTKWAGSYFSDVEEGQTELWAYYRSNALQALIGLHAKDRSIAECQAHGNATPKFKPRQARAILAALNANGDDDEAFTRVGAYSVFGESAPPKARTLTLDNGRVLGLWAFPSEIVAKVRKAGRKRWRWSRFYRKDGCWQDDWNNSLQLGELFELARTRPDVRKRLGFVE